MMKKDNRTTEELPLAITIARKAGKYLLTHFRRDTTLRTERGLVKEITTRYDKESDRIIIREIKKRFPAHNILTEEHGFFDNRSDYTWIVDSLDGSSNFANSNPFFAVSIALMHNKKVVLGVVYAPFLQELFTAEKGKGAFLNNKSIRVSTINTLAKSYLVSCEGGEKSTKRIAALNARLHKRAKDMRKLGSASLEGAWVACGRAEGYLVPNIAPWDVAAAVLLVKEAGGSVSDFRGRSWKPEQSDLIMSNRKVHAQILKNIKRE